LEVYAKLSKCGDQVLLAACDKELLGKVLRAEKLVFNIKEEFYKGPKIPLDDVVELIEDSTIVNIVGPNIVKLAIEKGMVHPDAVLEICGIPHAQIVKI
jgi:hypothetical protein